MSTGLTLIGGGVRSGKSAFALQLARALPGPRTFIATAQAGDTEMHTRIQRHVQERGADFATWEVPTDLPGALQSLPRGQVVVVDCLTLWLSNLLLHNPDEAHLRHQIHTLTQVLSSHPLRLFLVTNEVGMGIVPMSPLGRAFRDVAGWAHQALAPLADSLYLAVLGSIMRLRPGPIVLEPPGGPHVPVVAL